MSRFHALCGLLVAANIGTALHVVGLYAGTTARPEGLRMLPAGIATTQGATGEQVGALGGRIVVLGFASASDEIALDIMDRVSSGADADSVRVILFSDSPSVVSTRVADRDISVVPSSHREWMRLVNASTGFETWSVYDERGVQRARGGFSRGGLEGAVGKLFGTTPDYSATLLTAQLQPHFAPDGSTFVDDIPSPSRAHAVLFVRRLMSGCPIATALRTIDDAAARAEGASFSVLVPPDWLDREIEAMKVNYSLRAPVRRAPSDIAAVWRNLERIYGAAATAGFFVKFESGEEPQVLTEVKSILRFLGADTP